MSREERIEMQLHMIYEKLFDLDWKLNQMNLEKRKKEMENQKKDAEMILEEIHHQENQYWNVKDEQMSMFNRLIGDREVVDVKSCE